MPSKKANLSYKSYFCSPEKDWVIFIHGIGGNSRTFSLQLKGFKSHFNLLFPDLRGHGLSRDMPVPDEGKYSMELMAKDIFQLMEKLNIEKAHFVGNSFGAILIRIMEEQQPNKFLSVVMSGAVLRLKTSIYLVFKVGKLLAPYVNNHFLYTIMAYFIMPRKNHARSRQVFINEAKKIDPVEYTRWLIILEEVKSKLDVIFYTPFISDTFLIMGDQDHAFLKDSKRFCQINKSTKIEIFEHCGHLSNIEQYKEFNASAIEFFTSKQPKTKECSEPEEILEYR